MTGWVPQAAMDTVRADNRRLVNELAYARFRLDECEGPKGMINDATYHVERGEHSKAKPIVEKAKTHSPETAKQVAPVEKKMTETSTEKVTVTDKSEFIVTEEDKADGITWYYDRRVPRELDTTAFYLYIGHKSMGAPWLRMRSQYAGDHWLYVKTIKIHAGNVNFERHPDPTLLFSRAGDLVVTEWNDTPPTREDLRVIRQVVGSPDAEITFTGHNGNFTRKITDNEREAFINILRLYELMGKSGENKIM